MKFFICLLNWYYLQISMNLFYKIILLKFYHFFYCVNWIVKFLLAIKILEPQIYQFGYIRRNVFFTHKYAYVKVFVHENFE